MLSGALRRVGRPFLLLRFSRPARNALFGEERLARQPDPGARRAAAEAVHWLCRAQDRSPSRDYGVSSGFSTRTGWAPTSPKSSAITVPTLLDYAETTGDSDLIGRAEAILDRLVVICSFPPQRGENEISREAQIALENSAAEIIRTLAAATPSFGGRYRTALDRISHWLYAGRNWDRPSRRPLIHAADQARELVAAAALLEAADVLQRTEFEAAAKQCIKRVVLGQSNGGSRLTAPPIAQPADALASCLYNLLDCYLLLGDAPLLEAAVALGDGLGRTLSGDGRIPARIVRWSAAARGTCPGVNAQIAYCWLLLHELTGEWQWMEKASCCLSFVRRTMNVSGRPELRGAVKACFPTGSTKLNLQYPSSSAKWLVDACLLENDIVDQLQGRRPVQRPAAASQVPAVIKKKNLFTRLLPVTPQQDKKHAV